MNNFFDSNASYVDLLIDKYNPPSILTSISI